LVDVTVSIVTGGSRELILDCLGSLYQNADGLTLEVIIIDNARSAGLAEAIRGRFPDAVVKANEIREGFSANHNKVLRVATGEFVFILNDDTVVHPGALRAIVSFMRAHPEAGVVGGFLLNPDGTPQYTGKARPTLLAAAMISMGLHRIFPDNPVTAGYYRKKDTYAEVEEVESVNGAAMMVRRDILPKVGLLDDGFFMYCEDVDYSIRVREAGYRLYCLANAKVTHYRGKSGSGRKMVVIYHKSLLRFYRKHEAKRHFFLINWLVYAALLLRLLIYYARGQVRSAAAAPAA